MNQQEFLRVTAGLLESRAANLSGPDAETARNDASVAQAMFFDVQRESQVQGNSPDCK